MEIRAGGQTWHVDAHEISEGSAAERACWEVTFTLPEREGDRVDMRWIPRPERLTESVARTLFELAGERLWRDPRSGEIHRIQLVDDSEPGGDADLSRGQMMVRFRTSSGTGTAPYELRCPLGLASDEDLESLADRALV